MGKTVGDYILYEVIDEIKGGRSEKTYRGINKIDGKQYAVRVISHESVRRDRNLEKWIYQELTVLTNIQSHENILRYYEMLKTCNNIYLIYQYYNEGTLQSKIMKQYFDEKRSLLILKQLLEAYKFVLKRNVIHQDLKPQLIYFHDGIVKLKDFGESKKTIDYFFTKTMIGHPQRFMAPEVYQKSKYQQKSDIWSLGMILYEMISGENSCIQLYRQIFWKNNSDYNIKEDSNFSKQTISLLKKMLVKDPSKRIEWEELFEINITTEGKIVEGSSKKDHMKSDNEQKLSLAQFIEDPKIFHPIKQPHQKI